MTAVVCRSRFARAQSATPDASFASEGEPQLPVVHEYSVSVTVQWAFLSASASAAVIEVHPELQGEELAFGRAFPTIEYASTFGGE